MERVVGTVARGLRCPIINEGDNIEEIVVDSVLKASEVEGLTINDKDIVAITESIVARAQGNYATVDHIVLETAYVVLPKALRKLLLCLAILLMKSGIT